MYPGKSPRRRSLVPLLTLFSVLSVATAMAAPNDREISLQIDELVEKNYAKHKITPNAPADDGVFVRRAYLDILGRIPTASEAHAFLESESKGKRSKLIRHLLDSEGHVSHGFNWWADILRVKSRMEANAGQAYGKWVKDSIRSNKPYDKFVYELLTAEGYVWDNGAVGYYMRDAGMPLDNMSNTTQIFLGTQLVCAQCHNHPFDKWKQKDYYEMAAYTYGVETRVNPEKVVKIDKQVDRIEKRAMRSSRRKGTERYIKDALSDLLEPLSYEVTYDHEKDLKLPDDYQYKDGDPNEAVSARTIFGKRVSGKGSKARQTYAKWMTSPENPRFAKVIVNRLWKRVMGVGLVEPVDDFRDDTVASNPALMSYLERQFVSMGYDMRRFLAVIYGTRTYQREATAGDIDMDDYHYPGPVLKRMTAEQLWDSLLVATIPAADERQGSKKYRGRYADMKQRAEALLAMKSQGKTKQILDTAKRIAKVEEEHEKLTKELRKKIAKAREDEEDQVAKELTSTMRKARKDKEAEVKQIRKSFEGGISASSMMMSDSMMETKEKKSVNDRVDGRWKGFDKDYVRASELPSPAPNGHFLRSFGQSDRETIENSEVEASVGQVLSLMNGKVLDQLTDSKSILSRGLKAQEDDEAKQDFLFMSLLTRLPTESERAILNKEFATKGADKATESVTWALLNTKELLFVQ